MNTCPTVKVSDGEGSYIVINESDYDEKLHKLFDAEKPKKRAVKAK